MQFPRLATIAAIASICGGTIAVHGWLSNRWTEKTRLIVADELDKKLQPMRESVAATHRRIDEHLLKHQ